MKDEGFIKINEELKNRIQKNNEQINIYDERIRLSSVNQFEYKAIITIIFSLLSFFTLLFLPEILTKSGIIASLTRAIPTESFSLIITGCSLCVGTIGRKILERKFKIKERLKQFTTANTQSEKLQEEVKYTVELEKAKNRNKVIQQTLDLLNSNQSILNSLSHRYDMNDRTMPQTLEENKKGVEDFSKLLKDKYTELDILTTKKILNENFWKVRTKGQKVKDTMMTGMLGGLFTMIYGNLPHLIVMGYIPSSGLMPLFTPFIAGFMGAIGYMIKRNKDYIHVFNNLNNELGENALPDEIKEEYEKHQDTDAKIENKIRDISKNEIKLYELKRIMETFITGSEDKEKTIKISFSKKHTIENPKKVPIFGYNQEDLMAFMDENIFVGAERKPQVEEIKRTLNNRKN